MDKPDVSVHGLLDRIEQLKVRLSNSRAEKMTFHEEIKRAMDLNFKAGIVVGFMAGVATMSFTVLFLMQYTQ